MILYHHLAFFMKKKNGCFAVSNMVTCTGKCIPITRGGGIYQEHMNEALERLNDGEWVSM